MTARQRIRCTASGGKLDVVPVAPYMGQKWTGQHGIAVTDTTGRLGECRFMARPQ